MVNEEREIFSVAGTISDKILIFDIDDTIIYSNANIEIYNKDGKLINVLTSAEYNDYVWKDGEYPNFRNFDSSSLLNKAKLTTYWDTLKREYNKGTHIAILTARSKPTMIKKFILHHGIDIKDELIFCCGYSRFPWKGTVQEKKSKVIEHLYTIGYKTFVFFDDNINNLNEAKRLETKYDIKVQTVHVKNV